MFGLKESGRFQCSLSMLLSAFLLFSCAKGKDDTEGEDRSTPYVASISPDNNATGVSSTSTITITFSKAIPPSVVTVDSDGQCTKNVQVSSDSFSTCLPLSSDGGDIASKIFILTPNTFNNKIPSGTSYSIKVSSSIKDYYDMTMDADKNSSFTTVKRCSPLSDCSWSQVSPVEDLTGRSGHSGLVFSKKMWLFGGYDNNTDYFKDVMSSPDSSSSSEGKWDNLTTTMVWSKRNEHVSLSFKGKMWVIGGKNASTNLADVWSSSTGLAWDNQTLTGTPPSSRSGHAGVVFNSKIWILGGQSGSSWVKDVYSSSDGAAWTQESDAGWGGRSGHAAVVYDNKIWIMGGNDNSSDLKEVWTFDGTSWDNQTSPTVTWEGMKDHSTHVFDGKIWILGGNDNGSRIKKFYTYDGTSWSSAVVPSWSQRSSLVSYDFNNYLWVVGGDNGTSGSTHMKDVWKFGKTD